MSSPAAPKGTGGIGHSSTELQPLAKALVAGLPDAVVLMDLECRPLHYNSAYASMSGLRHRALQARLAERALAWDLVGATSEIDRENARDSLQEKRALRVDEVEVTNSQGDSFSVIMSFMPLLDSAEKPVALLQSLRDVSAEASMQRRYKELLEKERDRARQLEELVKQRTADLEEALRKVEHLSRTDPLTGLWNRRTFDDYARQAIQLADRHERSLAILMFDLDYFKRVNDTYGHQAGDDVLKAVGKALVSILRGTDRVARFGGEEFIALLSETAEKGVISVGERTRQVIRELPFTEIVPGAEGRQTVSVGVAIYPHHGKSLRELVAQADKALYVAKRAGRDRVELPPDSSGNDG